MSEGSVDVYNFWVTVLVMPLVSLFGLMGNSMSAYILRKREVKLKRDFVDLLCCLAAFDKVLLVSVMYLKCICVEFF